MSQADVLVREDEYVIKVRGDSPVQQIARSIRIAVFQQHKMPVIRAVGAGAVNQACKGIAVSRGYVATQGFDLGVNIGFANVTSDSGDEIVSMSFLLFLR